MSAVLNSGGCASDYPNQPFKTCCIANNQFDDATTKTKCPALSNCFPGAPATTYTCSFPEFKCVPAQGSSGKTLKACQSSCIAPTPPPTLKPPPPTPPPTPPPKPKPTPKPTPKPKPTPPPSPPPTPTPKGLGGVTWQYHCLSKPMNGTFLTPIPLGFYEKMNDSCGHYQGSCTFHSNRTLSAFNTNGNGPITPGGPGITGVPVTSGCASAGHAVCCFAPPPPAGKCTGTSAGLTAGDCTAWQKPTRNPLYTKWAESKCGTKVHTDPCSCSFPDPNKKPIGVQCANGRITTVDFFRQRGLNPSAGIPVALLDLTGLQSLALAELSLVGSIPASIGQLSDLSQLALSQNDLTGSVPEELVQLKKLTNFMLQHNPGLSGVLPALDFAHIGCCSLVGDTFTCPLPPGAERCTCGGGALTKCANASVEVNWSWGGCGKKEEGTMSIAPGAGSSGKGAQVATCNDGSTSTLYCQVTREAASPALTLQSHFTKSDGIHPDGPAVKSGCSVIVHNKPRPDLGQCCFVSPCTGTSSSLSPTDCGAWKKFTRNPLYTKWAEGKCGTKVHTDPCSCNFNGQTQCANGRITLIDMNNQGLPGSGGIPLPLLGLTGLTYLRLWGNALQGSIPPAIGQLQQLIYLNLGGNALQGSIPPAIGQLQQLATLDLGPNSFTGTVPQELTTLKHLNFIDLVNNPQLTGKLPAFNFSQFTSCCAMEGDVFTCPLPAGANTCVGGPGCGGKEPPPTCK